MLETSLCYIDRGDALLMLHRVRKKDDVNAGKWIGVGGKMETGESPEKCLLREVWEETGLSLLRWAYRGIVDFQSADWRERMHLFTADDFEGILTDCDEGELRWIPKDEVDELPMWAGDRVFFRLLREGEPFFRLYLRYEGEDLVEVQLNGEIIAI